MSLQVGDEVKRGDTLLEIDTEVAVVAVESKQHGKLNFSLAIVSLQLLRINRSV